MPATLQAPASDAAATLPQPSADLIQLLTFKEAMNYLKERVNGHGGIILLDAQGRCGISHNTPRMAWALRTINRLDSGVVRS